MEYDFFFLGLSLSSAPWARTPPGPRGSCDFLSSWKVHGANLELADGRHSYERDLGSGIGAVSAAIRRVGASLESLRLEGTISISALAPLIARGPVRDALLDMTVRFQARSCGHGTSVYIVGLDEPDGILSELEPGVDGPGPLVPFLALLGQCLDQDLMMLTADGHMAEIPPQAAWLSQRLVELIGMPPAVIGGRAFDKNWLYLPSESKLTRPDIISGYPNWTTVRMYERVAAQSQFPA